MLRRVVHRSRPISSQIRQNGVPAATSSSNRPFSASDSRFPRIASLPTGSNPIEADVALIP
jgi:hypothetical protein